MVSVSERTSFLFAMPSFLRGMARAIDLGDTLTVYNQSRTPEEADALAIKNDWASVGDSLRGSIKKYQSECG